ncbi:MAG: hypothetical protein ACR2PS_04900 [Pseudomonadales bacterium]
MPDINFKPYSVPIACLALVLTALPFIASSNELNGYMMSIQANAPGIEHLRAGDYRKAIAASRSVLAEPGWKAAAHNNICVCYTILKDYKRAQRSCAKAVKILQAAKARQRSSKRQDTTSLAMAYSNRGVLRALSDDLQSAHRDFIKAQKYAANSQKYEHNYALLQWNLSINGVDTRISAN